MVVRGRILRDTSAGPGLLSAGGSQYAFPLEDIWRSERPPRIGMIVDATFDADGMLCGICIVAQAEIAHTQARQAATVAYGTYALVDPELMNRLGLGVLIAECLLLAAFFLLANVSLVSRPFTGWDLTGLDLRTFGTGEHGVLSLLGLACMIAPILPALITKPWSRWLRTGPLAFLLICASTLSVEAAQAGQQQKQLFINLAGQAEISGLTHRFAGTFHPEAGLILVVGCALYLARQAGKSWSA